MGFGLDQERIVIECKVTDSEPAMPVQNLLQHPLRVSLRKNRGQDMAGTIPAPVGASSGSEETDIINAAHEIEGRIGIIVGRGWRAWARDPVFFKT